VADCGLEATSVREYVCNVIILKIQHHLFYVL